MERLMQLIPVGLHKPISHWNQTHRRRVRRLAELEYLPESSE